MWIEFVIELVAEAVELILDLCLEKVLWRTKRKRSDKEGEKTV